VHKPRTRLLCGYEPDPVPPPTVCAKAQRPPPAEGKAVTASPRDGRRTADEGPRGKKVRKGRPPQPAQLGYSTRTPSGMGNRTGPCRANPSRYIFHKTSPEARPAAYGSAPSGTQALGPPHPCRGRSDACAATVALWVPRGCPLTPSCPPGTHLTLWAARDRSGSGLPHPASRLGVRGLPDLLRRRRPWRHAQTPLLASLRNTLISCHL